jgi:hypothetical protein
VQGAVGLAGFAVTSDDLVVSLELQRAIELGGTAFAESLGPQVITSWAADGAFRWGQQLKPEVRVEASIVIGPAQAHVVGAGWTDGRVELGGLSLDPDAPIAVFLTRIALDGTVEELTQIGRIEHFESDTSSRDADALVEAVVSDPSGETTVFVAFEGQATFGDQVFTSEQSHNELVVRLAADGSVRWVRPVRFSDGAYTTSGVPIRAVNAAAPLPDGGVVSVGQWSGTLELDADADAELSIDTLEESAFAAAWSAEGVLEWARVIAAPAGAFAMSVAPRLDGSVAVAGRTSSDALSIGAGQPDELELVSLELDQGFLAILGPDGSVVGGTFARGSSVVGVDESGDLVLGMAWQGEPVPATADQPELRADAGALQVFDAELNLVETTWVSDPAPDAGSSPPVIEAVIPHGGRTLVAGKLYGSDAMGGTQENSLAAVDVP